MTRLSQRLNFVGAVKTITDLPEWRVIEAHLRAAINQERRKRDSVDPNDPDSLNSHANRALYVTGKIQGMEYLLNDFVTAAQEEANLLSSVKEAEQELKSGKERKR